MSKFTYLQESKNHGKRIEELVKGSLDYQRYEISQAFFSLYPNTDEDYWMIEEVFSDHLLVTYRQWDGGKRMPEKPDEYYSVDFTRAGEAISFQPREQWKVVELTYQPKTMQESVWMMESAQDGARKIQIKRLMTAGEINGNNRRYPAPVLKAAVEELRTHLHESAGQGRLMLLGEVEHPSEKGTRRANLMETVIRWTEVTFDGSDVNVSGLLATETEGGRHIQALAAIGVVPGGSIRGYGLTESVKVDGKQIEEVTELHITGIDVVSEASFANSQTILESTGNEPPAEDKKMNLLEKLLALLKARPDLFKGVNESTLRAMTEAQLDALWAKIDEAMGIDTSKIDVNEALKAMAEKAAKFDENQKQVVVDAAIAEATKDLPYGDRNAMFIEAVKAAKPQDAEAVKLLVESKRKEYDKLFAGQKLTAMGFGGQVSGVRPVLEAQTGVPEFARAGFEITESIRKHENRAKRNIDLRVESPAAVFTQKLLERFDELYQGKLLAEARALQEAEQTSDLNLPYSVSRAIIAEAFPDLVAANIFDVGVINTSPTRLYFEATTGESGYTGTVTDELVTGGAEGVWYDLAYGRVTPDSVTVTSNPAGTTYVEGTDYVIDYAAGRIKFLTPGSIGANDVLVDYSYTAIRKGEMTPIERVKLSLSYITIEAAADRLADQISREAIVFSQSQLGMDAVAMTMASMMRQIRRKIDQGLLYTAFSAVKAVPSNKTADWTIATTQDAYASLARLMGNAGVIVANRYYTPTFFLMSVTNADRLSNWEGFQNTGFPNALLNAAGFAGAVKGKPIFASTEFPDSLVIAGNRELVAHRVFKPASIFGPYPTYDVSGGSSKLLAADQYYVEEFNVTESPINEKGAFVPVVESGS